MIPIDKGKFIFLRGVDIYRCADESVRLIRYTKAEPPKEYATLQRHPSYYGENTEYSLSVHLPHPRHVETLVTVAHTSANCWKVTVSTAAYSDMRSYKTLNEVTDMLKSVFA